MNKPTLEQAQKLIGRTFEIVYKNWQGVVEKRTITGIKLFEGSTEYHPTHQVFLHAHCHKRNAARDFAFNDILRISKIIE